MTTNGRGGAAEGEALAPIVVVAVREGDAVCNVKRRTTLLQMSAIIHWPVPSGPIDGLLKYAAVAIPPSPDVPLLPATPATVERIPAAET